MAERRSRAREKADHAAHRHFSFSRSFGLHLHLGRVGENEPYNSVGDGHGLGLDRQGWAESIKNLTGDPH